MNASPPVHPQTIKDFARAAQEGNIERYAVLLQRHGPAIVNMRGDDQWTPLTLTAAWGRCATVRRLLDDGADIEMWGCKGMPPLVAAAWRGKKDTVELLLSRGAKIDVMDWDGATALLSAVRECHLDMITLLLAKGADVNVTLFNRMSPLMFAADRGRPDILRALLEHGADIHAKDYDGKTVMDRMHESRQTAAVKQQINAVLENWLKKMDMKEIDAVMRRGLSRSIPYKGPVKFGHKP